MEHFQNINYIFRNLNYFIILSLVYLIGYIFTKTNYKYKICCVKLIPAELIQSLNLRSNGFDIETESMAKSILI